MNQVKPKTSSIIRDIGYVIVFTFFFYLVACLIYAVILAFLKKQGLVSYINVGGFYQATSEYNAELVEFYNTLNTLRWTYLGLLKEYPVTTGLISVIIFLIVLWMCSVKRQVGVVSAPNSPLSASPEKSTPTPEHALSYKNYIYRIINEVNKLKSLWDSGYLNSINFREWYGRFKPLENDFKASYPESDVSWLFLELQQLESALKDTEKTQNTYRKYIEEKAPVELTESVKTLLREQENFVSQVVAQAVAHCKKLQEEF